MDARLWIYLISNMWDMTCYTCSRKCVFMKMSFCVFEWFVHEDVSFNFLMLSKANFFCSSNSSMDRTRDCCRFLSLSNCSKYWPETRARFPGDMHVLVEVDGSVPFSSPTTAVAAEVSASLRLLSWLTCLMNLFLKWWVWGGLVHTLVLFVK